SESSRPLHAQNSDSSIRKEGKFRMLNHIFCKKKKELHPSQQTDLNQECQLKEETSEVDDIITMFDCVAEPSTVRKRNNESEKVHLVEDTSSKDFQKSSSNHSRQILAGKLSDFGPQDQRSKSEHDLFDGKSKEQKAGGQPWKTESSQILTHKAWISTPSERLLDKLLHGTSSPLDVL
ncbi:hypothetical protein M9458_021304, partial [Cirrhinus mrigala]